ncbi:MAG: hypothetical protein R3D03_13450 [Geminicoccaceae bacterium]
MFFAGLDAAASPVADRLDRHPRRLLHLPRVGLSRRRPQPPLPDRPRHRPPLVAVGAIVFQGEWLSFTGTIAFLAICIGIWMLASTGRGTGPVPLLYALATGTMIGGYTICDGMGGAAHQRRTGLHRLAVSRWRGGRSSSPSCGSAAPTGGQPAPGLRSGIHRRHPLD